MPRDKSIIEARKKEILESCFPITRVLYRACTENCDNEEQKERIVDYLFEAENMWIDPIGLQNNEIDRYNSFELGVLVSAYSDMEKKGIIDKNGVILKPQKLATGDFFKDIDPKIIPPNLAATKEFKKLAAQPTPKVTTAQKE